MRYRAQVNWCMRRYLKANPWLSSSEAIYRTLSVRRLYSLTKKWPQKYDSKTRIEMENYWNLRIQEENRNRPKLDLTSDKEKYYALSMFPYPSGKLHMGHVRVYTLSDCMARYQRLKGKQVIHPMGWDAFGLPAENAAMERGEMPDKWTQSNIQSMRKQLEELQCSFDWDREISTCDPSYYKWSQFIFLKMYDAGLVYQKEGLVNWDPVDQTVLADEQIDEKGHSWRSGAKVEKRYLRQWYMKTTAYSKALYDGLDEVNPDYWKDIIAIQKDWIGQCTGTRLEFVLKICSLLYNIGKTGFKSTEYWSTFLYSKKDYEGYLFGSPSKRLTPMHGQNGEETMIDPLTMYTDHPEALYGISHIALSPDHRFNDAKYYKTEQSDAQSKDILLSLHAVHPVTGDNIPLLVSSSTQYLEKCDLHLGMPSIFEKDKENAMKFGLTFNEVIDSDDKLINSQQFTGLTKEQAHEEVCNYAKEKGFGGHMVSSKLNDWLISRQRYWGTPIPIIHCPKCKLVPVPYEDLPVKLPKLDSLTRKGLSPLTQATEWLNVKCPKCGGDATRETDTMDTFVDSSWYFLRYLDPSNSCLPFDTDVANRLMPVDLYIGGKEHATLHLYFARFFNHFLCDAGYLKHREPFTNLLVQGMVLGQSYRVKGTGQYLRLEEVDFLNPKAPVEKSTGKPLTVEWEKMSKSKYNGVDPQEIIDEYGVSSTRMTIVYNVAPKSDRRWSSTEFRGVLHWQGRIWKLVTMVINNYKQMEDGSHNVEEWNRKISEIRNIYLAEINWNFETTFMVSVAITAMQQLTDFLRSIPAEVAVNSEVFIQTLADIIIMISPISPAFSMELWEGLRSKVTFCDKCDMSKPVEDQKWPCLDIDSTMLLVVKNAQPMFDRVISFVEPSHFANFYTWALWFVNATPPTVFQLGSFLFAEYNKSMSGFSQIILLICNGSSVYDIKIPYLKLNNLTTEEALNYSQGHCVFQEHFQGHNVKKVSLHVQPDYKASLNYSIPSIDASVMKMLNKQLKKSRN